MLTQIFRKSTMGLVFRITNEDNVIIGGDFNCPLNPLLYKKGGILIPCANVIRAIETLK